MSIPSKGKVHYRDYFRNQREFAAASCIGGIIKKPLGPCGIASSSSSLMSMMKSGRRGIKRMPALAPDLGLGNRKIDPVHILRRRIARKQFPTKLACNTVRLPIEAAFLPLLGHVSTASTPLSPQTPPTPKGHPAANHPIPVATTFKQPLLRRVDIS